MPGDSNLEGVFVKGKPLVEFLADQERDVESKAIEMIRKRGEQRQRFTVVYADEKAVNPDTRKVAKQVKRLTDREIRKEYGIMQKPFESRAENAIWVIMEKGPLNVIEVGEQMQFKGKINTLSAMLATIWKRLGNTHDHAAGVLERKQHGRKFYYSKAKGVDISVEAAIEKYRLVGSRSYQKAAENGMLDKSDSEDSSSPSLPRIDQLQFIQGKGSALELKVSGQIDIVFSFKR